MNRIITIIVLATFFPMQLYATNFNDFNFESPTQREFFVPRGPDKPEVQYSPDLNVKILEEPPKGVSAENSDTKWWLWGGLAAVAGGIVALIAGGSKGGGSTSGSGGGGTATTTVTGSW